MKEHYKYFKKWRTQPNGAHSIEEFAQDRNKLFYERAKAKGAVAVGAFFQDGWTEFIAVNDQGVEVASFEEDV